MHKDKLFRKSCSCGGGMTIHMHTLIYSAKVKITEVPVYTCSQCERYEPFPFIKKDLSQLLIELGNSSAKRNISFTERNEWALILKETFAGYVTIDINDLEEVICSAIQSRIDLLLDIYKFAAQCEDREWMEETALRLSQITHPAPERTK